MDRQAFRAALSDFATGVAIVTARHEGVNFGVTINSFNSVSLDPPLVLFSLGRNLASLPALQKAGHVSINLLSASQQSLSNQFARASGADKWEGVSFSEGLGGAPLISGSLAHFQCRTRAVHDGGDHQIFVAEVIEFDRPGAESEPLLFFRSRYSQLAGAPAWQPNGDVR